MLVQVEADDQAGKGHVVHQGRTQVGYVAGTERTVVFVDVRGYEEVQDRVTDEFQPLITVGDVVFDIGGMGERLKIVFVLLI